MKEWVKLFEVNGESVLIYLEPSGDDYKMNQIVYTDVGIVNAAIVFEWSKAKTDNFEEWAGFVFESFKAIDQSFAEVIYTSIQKLIGNAV